MSEQETKEKEKNNLPPGVTYDPAGSEEYPYLNTATGKRFYYSAPGVRNYQSGAIYDERKGRGRLSRGATKGIITAENAHQMIQRRVEKEREYLLEGAREAVKANRSLTDTDVEGEKYAAYYGQALGERALDKDDKSGVHAFRQLAEIAGWTRDKSEGVALQQGQNRIEARDAEQLAEIVRMIEAKRAASE